MSQDKSVRKGRLRLKREFAFVDMEDTPGREGSVRVSLSDVGNAMQDDMVLVRSTMSREGRLRGRVEKVVERATDKLVGTIDIRRGRPVLVSERATEPLQIVLENSPVPANALQSGLRAVGEIRSFANAYLPAKVTITRVLGKAGDPAVELEASKFAWNVPHDFPKAVIAAANELPETVQPEDLAGRLDLRALGVFTIDPTDARDFDDALSVEKTGTGYRVGIHIADVSHYVQEGSVIDQEAYKRATSTYLPGFVIPMLPERLSNGLCSLVEGQDRLTVSVFVNFNHDLEAVGYSHGRSVIHSKRRFTYDEVDVVIDTGQGDFRDEIHLLLKMAKKLNAIRIKRGALDLELPEKKPILDIHGRVIGVKTIGRTWSHRLIEEFMIHANEYVARAMKKKGIYRIHEAPSPEKMMRFREMAAIVSKAVVRGNLHKILDAFKLSPARPVLETLVLRAMQEARYSAENRGHYGLASEAYSHFTSPIRRYPDLVAHRILLGSRPQTSLVEIARHTSRREREAIEAERDALNIKYLEYAESRLGDKVTGIIDQVSREGLFISLEFGARGMVPISELGREDFRFERETLSLYGRATRKRYAMGDEISVVIASVNVEGRQLNLVPAGLGEKRPGSPKAKTVKKEISRRTGKPKSKKYKYRNKFKR